MPPRAEATKKIPTEAAPGALIQGLLGGSAMVAEAVSAATAKALAEYDQAIKAIRASRGSDRALIERTPDP
jgi:hypothetical protein